jgi:hypothetical protein
VVEGEAIMPSIIKPLTKIKKSKFKKNYLASNKRWGNVVTTYKENKMPVPEGEITTSEIFAAEEAQDIEDFDIVFEMNEDKIPLEEVKKELGIADGD